jgi:hypothetical protein
MCQGARRPQPPGGGASLRPSGEARVPRRATDDGERARKPRSRRTTHSPCPHWQRLTTSSSPASASALLAVGHQLAATPPGSRLGLGRAASSVSTVRAEVPLRVRSEARGALGPRLSPGYVTQRGGRGGCSHAHKLPGTPGAWWSARHVYGGLFDGWYVPWLSELELCVATHIDRLCNGR